MYSHTYYANTTVHTASIYAYITHARYVKYTFIHEFMCICVYKGVNHDTYIHTYIHTNPPAIHKTVMPSTEGTPYLAGR